MRRLPHDAIPTSQNMRREGCLSIRQWVRAAVAVVLLGGSPAAAQDYPNKPVRIVVGFAAGSASDLVARALAQKLNSALGQPFIVEVRPGAGSNVAAQYVVRSPKDGYTLFVTTSSSTIRGASTANFGFDFAADLAPIAPIASAPFVLTAYPGLGVRTVQDFHCPRQGQAGCADLRRNGCRDHWISRRVTV
jgi:tripartite-type tricarboxylate transporter receptor subunit TctC